MNQKLLISNTQTGISSLINANSYVHDMSIVCITNNHEEAFRIMILTNYVLVLFV